jgi:hypothetical protein
MGSKTVKFCGFCETTGRGRPGYHSSSRWYDIDGESTSGYSYGGTAIAIDKRHDIPDGQVLRMCGKAYGLHMSRATGTGSGRRPNKDFQGVNEVLPALDTRSVRSENVDLKNDNARLHSRALAAEAEASIARGEADAARLTLVKWDALLKTALGKMGHGTTKLKEHAVAVVRRVVQSYKRLLIRVEKANESSKAAKPGRDKEMERKNLALSKVVEKLRTRAGALAAAKEAAVANKTRCEQAVVDKDRQIKELSYKIDGLRNDVAEARVLKEVMVDHATRGKERAQERALQEMKVLHTQYSVRLDKAGDDLSRVEDEKGGLLDEMEAVMERCADLEGDVQDWLRDQQGASDS